MLFAILYTARETSEADQKRSLNLFTKWTPPAGYQFKAHYALCDGSGGLALAEATTTAPLLEAHAPWPPFFDFKTMPMLEIDAAVPIFQRVNAWRDSIP